MRPFGDTPVSQSKGMIVEELKKDECLYGHDHGKVWEEFHPKLKQFVLRRIPDEQSSEDVLQDGPRVVPGAEVVELRHAYFTGST